MNKMTNHELEGWAEKWEKNDKQIFFNKWGNPIVVFCPYCGGKEMYFNDSIIVACNTCGIRSETRAVKDYGYYIVWDRCKKGEPIVD